MRTIKIYIKTSKVGSQCDDTMEVEDDATDDEIEEMAKDAAFNMMEWGWSEKGQ